MPFETELLNSQHNKKVFKCTNKSLNNYLKLQAKKESRKNLARVYVLCNQQNDVIGYYSLSSSELPRDAVPEDLQNKLPLGYVGYPAILIGRLAVTESETGRGLGGELLIDAIERCLQAAEKIGTRAILVDPIDESARAFYSRFMFNSLPDANRMVLYIDYNLRKQFGLVDG